MLVALARGEVQALGRIYDRYSAPVYHLLLGRGLDESSAQDALQEVFLALLNRGKKAIWIDNLRAYLLGIARHLSGRARRRRSREAPGCTTEGGCELSAAPVGQTATEALDTLRLLPREQAEVVVLKVWHDLTFAEIAQVLHIPQNTAASRYRYALEKLRTIWGEGEDGTE